MLDFAAARRMMVDGQIRTADVTDSRILDAFGDLPRERFVPPQLTQLAYLDRDLRVADGPPARYLLKPMTLARMIQALELRSGEKVLDLACASGYSSALMARLGCKVVGVESDPALTQTAARALAELGIGNASFVTGPLPAGAPDQAPYEAVLLNGMIDRPSETLLDQLRDGGRLVCIVRHGPIGRATLYRSAGGDVSGRALFDAAAPELPEFVTPPAFVF